MYNTYITFANIVQKRDTPNGVSLVNVWYEIPRLRSG